MIDTEHLIGQDIDRYRIIKHIERGGMADAYLAKDVSLQRKIALKVRLDTLSIDAQFVQRFQREAQTVAKLEHTNIVHSTGLMPEQFTTTQQPYLAMQYIDGGSPQNKLAELADLGKLLTTEQALNIIRQISLALRVAHNAHIIHQDLKPCNLLVQPDGTPVLVDLGIALAEDNPKPTQTGAIIGSPHYMSPEQVRKQPLDGSSDLYSLGIILYELLVGRRPFPASESIARKPHRGPNCCTTNGRTRAGNQRTNPHRAARGYDRFPNQHARPYPGEQHCTRHAYTCIAHGNGRATHPQIVFQSNRDGDYEIFIMNSDGRQQRQLTINSADDNYPVVSLDSTQILFESVRDGNWEVYAMNIDGSQQRRLTNAPSSKDLLPTWSQDGQQIAFISNRDGDYEIFIMNADSSNVHQITFNTLREGHISWSADNRLVYNAGTEDSRSWDIYTIDPDGNNQQQPLALQ